MIRKVLKRLKKILLYLFVLHLLYILALKWINPPITIIQLMNWVDGHGLKRDYVAYDEMSSHIKLAVIASEDQLFPDHNGFDWKSIEKAMTYNKKKPGRIRGASTISQQVAKNVFLWPGRSWIRKGLEVYFTFMIELLWGKQRILHVYLNVIETGPGLFGVEAAAQTYFNKPALKLTRQEAAMIAACLPNPKKYTVKPVSKYVLGRYHPIMIQMDHLAGDPDIRSLTLSNDDTRVKKSRSR